MNKNFLFSVMPVMVLVFGLIGCGDDGSTDTWTNITSLSQVNGTWKGSYTKTKTVDGITCFILMEETVTFDANAETISGTDITTMTFSGTGIAEKWSSIKEEFEEGESEFEEGDYSRTTTVAFNEANHSVTETRTFSANIQLHNVERNQINQNGTKIKIPASEDSPEAILTKQ